jgi:hypothetical protein
MAGNPKGRRNNIPFLGVAEDMGRTTYWKKNKTLNETQHYVWNSKPNYQTAVNPYVKIEYCLPSRFVLAHTDTLDVAFLALDPERMGDMMSDGTVTDLGDDKFHYKKGKPIVYVDFQDGSHDVIENSIIHPHLKVFMLYQFPKTIFNTDSSITDVVINEDDEDDDVDVNNDGDVNNDDNDNADNNNNAMMMDDADNNDDVVTVAHNTPPLQS